MNEQSSYLQHWDDKFSSRSWGKYPPEDLIRFIGRNYPTNRPGISVLEVGCGPGANLWFLHREGFKVSGIDGSNSAIEQASKRLIKENIDLNNVPPDLKVGNFAILPWEDHSFDAVVDIFAIYANQMSVIKSSLQEIHRVLKPGGRFYSKFWGTNTTGYGEGIKIEEGTFDQITSGPCKDMGVSHFFKYQDISSVFKAFEIINIETITRTISSSEIKIEEYHCHFLKE